MSANETARADLLARIRKCLALGKSSNENEAAAALAKARELMDAHGLTAEDIELSEIGEESAKGNCAQRPPRWEKILSSTVERAMGCAVVLGGDGERIFIGPGAAPQIAAYAFAVLFRKLKAARAEYVRMKLKRCTTARKRQRADIFSEAWACAVYIEARKLMPDRPVDEAVGKYVARRFSGLATVGSREASLKGGRVSGDYWAGYERGQAVELHNAVGGAGGRVELLA